jgi:siroheme synthase-like protein
MTREHPPLEHPEVRLGNSDDFPVALKLHGKKCLIIGSAPETAERGWQLLASGARVQIIAAKPNSALLTLSRLELGCLSQRAWHPEDLNDCWLVVFTDKSAEEAETLGRLCNDRHLLFCAVDQPQYGNFNHVAVARAGRLWAAVGTGGAAPALAARLRHLLQELFDRSNLADVAERFAQLRAKTPSHLRRDTLRRAAERLQLRGELTEAERSEPGAPSED